MKITWFRHNHENRNDLLRFGLMRLHFRGEVQYIERPLSDAGRNGFGAAVSNYKDPRHLSFLLCKSNFTRIKCIVDNEDSFALISPLVKEADVYFCAGYNSDFFEKKQFVEPYRWQDNTDISWYQQTLSQKVNELGEHFHKIRKFIPIAPNLAYPISLPLWKRRLRNAEHKLNRLTNRGNRFSDDLKGFEIRYSYLKELREEPLCYDIVLNDTLWGWPRHRVNLHNQLKSMWMQGYKIHSVLKWSDPVVEDGSHVRRMCNQDFPIMTAPINKPYEQMLAQARMAVFACGFHWGWRNIMMFALMTGIPVLTDRLLTEAYFNLNEFHIFQQEDHLWRSVEKHLVSIDEEKWKTIKMHNQRKYDQYMEPEVVANYFLKTIRT